MVRRGREVALDAASEAMIMPSMISRFFSPPLYSPLAEAMIVQQEARNQMSKDRS